MKKSIMALGLSLMIAVGSAAAQDGIKVVYEGETIQMDVAPIIQDGRTLVPLRAVLEKMGAEVTYENETQKITVTRGEMQAVLYPGNTTMIVLRENETGIFEAEEEVILDVPPAIVDDRTLLPIRYVVYAINDALDQITSGEPDEMVKWDPQTQTVIIQDGYEEAESQKPEENRPSDLIVNMVDGLPQIEWTDHFQNRYDVRLYTNAGSDIVIEDRVKSFKDGDIYDVQMRVEQIEGETPVYWGTYPIQERYMGRLLGDKRLIKSAHQIEHNQLFGQKFSDQSIVSFGVVDYLEIMDVNEEEKTVLLEHPWEKEEISITITGDNVWKVQKGDILRLPLLMFEESSNTRIETLDMIASPYPFVEQAKIKDGKLLIQARNVTGYTIEPNTKKNRVFQATDGNIELDLEADICSVTLRNEKKDRLSSEVIVNYAKEAIMNKAAAYITVTSKGKGLGHLPITEEVYPEPINRKEFTNLIIQEAIEAPRKAESLENDGWYGGQTIYNHYSHLNYAKVLYYDGMDNKTE